ncbi:MAG TPA: sigma-70 family RNA polymerase sigma factor [Vicinamibacterales bacterium]|jgi:RNA polymerase sigma-70 factor (ECF subfamily)|nr:sigma-70 family RNA polymerase sigma factor [Vicinamibacterales bacterium]
MHEHAERLVGSLVTADQELEREFEARLADSSRLAFRVAFSVLRQREDAEDVAQEAFAKAYRSFRQLRDRTRFRAWLVRMTWRMALDRQRANRRRLARELPVEVEAGLTWPERSRGNNRLDLHETTTADTVAARERAEHLWRAIEALPEKLRLVVVLAGIEGHDMHEVGALLDVPEGTVKSRLFLARKQLRERLSWMVTGIRN